MDSTTEKLGARHASMILAVICQFLVVYAPLVGVRHFLAIQSEYPGFEFTFPFIADLALALLLTASLVGLALSRSWGWSLAMMMNAAGLSLLFLYILTEPQASSWVRRETVAVVLAIAVLLLPWVRTHYSRRKTPWILAWWSKPLNTGADGVLVPLLALAQVLLNALLVLVALASIPYSTLFLLFLVAPFGIVAAVKLFSGRMLGRLLTLTWCLLGFIYAIAAWRTDLANLRNPALLHPDRSRDFLLVGEYCWIVGWYLFLTVVKGWLHDLRDVSPRAPS